MRRTQAAVIDGVYRTWEVDYGPVKAFSHAEGAKGLGTKQRARSRPLSGSRAGSEPEPGRGPALTPCVRCGAPTRSERCLPCVADAERRRKRAMQVRDAVAAAEAERREMETAVEAMQRYYAKRRAFERRMTEARRAGL